jgi:hypothetical protein
VLPLFVAADSDCPSYSLVCGGCAQSSMRNSCCLVGLLVNLSELGWLVVLLVDLNGFMVCNRLCRLNSVSLRFAASMSIDRIMVLSTLTYSSHLVHLNRLVLSIFAISAPMTTGVRRAKKCSKALEGILESKKGQVL